MIVYSDIFTGDELISDSYDLKSVGNGVAYEVDGKMFSIAADDDFGDVDNQREETSKDFTVKVSNVEQHFQLLPANLSKQAYYSSLKLVEKALEESRPEALEEFKKGAPKHAKTILDNFENYDFLFGESMSSDGMIIVKGWREDDETPYYIFWAHGLKETN